MSRKGKFFCIMVEKQVTFLEDKTDPPLNPASFPGQDLDEDRICYKIKCPKLDPPLNPLEVTDQFGTRFVQKFKPSLLCTPALKESITPTTTTTTTMPMCKLTGEDCNFAADDCCPGVTTGRRPRRA